MIEIMELWARGLRLVLVGWWPLMVAALIGRAILIVKRRRIQGAAVWMLALVGAPYILISTWSFHSVDSRAWLGPWVGSIGESRIELELQSARLDLLRGKIVSGSCHVGEKLIATIDGDRIHVRTQDGAFFGVLVGNIGALSGEVRGCGPADRTDRMALKHDSGRDTPTDFRVWTPAGWAPAPLQGGMVWHEASGLGTQMPDCGVIVTSDSSFAMLSNEDYIQSQSEEPFIRMAGLAKEDVAIGNWETNGRFGEQRALQVIYSATVNGVRRTSIVLQTVHAAKLYTFSCNAPSDQFPLVYADLLKVADSFEFI